MHWRWRWRLVASISEEVFDLLGEVAAKSSYSKVLVGEWSGRLPWLPWEKGMSDGLIPNSFTLHGGTESRWRKQSRRRREVRQESDRGSKRTFTTADFSLGKNKHPGPKRALQSVCNWAIVQSVNQHFPTCWRNVVCSVCSRTMSYRGRSLQSEQREIMKQLSKDNIRSDPHSKPYVSNSRPAGSIQPMRSFYRDLVYVLTVRRYDGTFPHQWSQATSARQPWTQSESLRMAERGADPENSPQPGERPSTRLLSVPVNLCYAAQKLQKAEELKKNPTPQQRFFSPKRNPKVKEASSIVAEEKQLVRGSVSLVPSEGGWNSTLIWFCLNFCWKAQVSFTSSGFFPPAWLNLYFLYNWWVTF